MAIHKSSKTYYSACPESKQHSDFSTPSHASLLPNPLITTTSKSSLPKKFLHNECRAKDRTTLKAPNEYCTKATIKANSKDYADPLKGREVFYNCSLCHFSLLGDSKLYRLPRHHMKTPRDGDGRIFCRDCWIWIYNLSMLTHLLNSGSDR